VGAADAAEAAAISSSHGPFDLILFDPPAREDRSAMTHAFLADVSSASVVLLCADGRALVDLVTQGSAAKAVEDG
jgi:hypothetical protein